MSIRQEPARRNGDIDRLRAVAIAFVLVSHLRFVWQPRTVDWVYRWTDFYTGVDLFFVISGFIVSKVLIADLARSDDRRRTILHFYLRRAFRILPQAYLWLSISVLLSLAFWTFGHLAKVSTLLREGVAIVLNVYNLAVSFDWLDEYGLPLYWSLSVEEQFYIVLPAFLVLVVGARRRAASLGVLILLVTLAIRPLAAAWGASPLFMATFTLLRIDQIALGVLLCLFSRTDAWRSLRPVWMRRPMAGLPTVLVLVSCLALLPGHYRPVEVAWNAVPALPLIGLVAGALVWIASYDDDLVLHFAATEKLLQWLGARSYALYLAHWPMIGLATVIDEQVLHGGATTRTVLFLALIVISAELSHVYVEKPLIGVGRRWVGRAPALT